MTHRSLISKASSLFLAFGLTLTSLGGAIYADDTGEQSTEQSDQDISITEPGQTLAERDEDIAMESVTYTVTLPYEEGYGYKYDETHAQPVDEGEDISMEDDILLFYSVGDEVEFTITVEEGAALVDHIKLYDPDDEEKAAIPYREKEKNEYVFTMPESDVYVEVTPGEPEVVPEPENAEPETTEPSLEENITVETSTAPDPEETTEAEEDPAEGIETAGDPQQETTAPIAEDTNQQQSAYTAETDTDGTPTQGSIEQVADYTIALNDETFDVKSDFTNISIDSSSQTIAYVSDDVMISVEGRYSTIYRVDTASGKFWFVLRPVVVSAAAAPAQAGEAPAEAAVSQEVPVDEPQDTPAEAPQETPAETPQEMPSDTPQETPAEVPQEAPAGVPQETPAETPQEAPAETPQEAPSEAPLGETQMNPESGSLPPESVGNPAGYTALYTVTLQADRMNADAPLTGALVTFADPDTGEEVGSANTTADAQAVFTSQEEAPALSLTAVLTTPPAGYVMNDAEYTVRKDGSTTMLLTGVTGTIQIITQKQDGSYPERTFVLKKSSGGADDVTIQTNEKGVATSENTLPYGNWNIYESGKLVATTIITEENGISLVYVDAEGNSTSKQVSVTITDNEKNVITGDMTAIFKIFKASDTEHTCPVRLYKINGEGTETSEYDQFKMDPDGSIQMAGNLENGDYVLMETTAPAGYKRNDKTVAFTVKDNVAAYTITISHARATEEAPAEDDGTTHTIIINNTIADSGDKKLEGVTYELYDAAGTTKLQEAISGEDGTASFADVASGTYLLKETAVPEYYSAVLKEDGRQISLSGADLMIDLEHHLSAFTLVRLYREREESAKTVAVSGVKYLVAPENNENAEITALAAQIAELRASEKTNIETLNSLEEGEAKNSLLSSYTASSADAIRTQIAEAAVQHGYSDITSAGNTYTTGEDGSFLVMYDGENSSSGLKHGLTYTVTEIDTSEASAGNIQPDTTVHRILVDDRGQVSEEGKEKGYAYTLKVITGKKAQTLATLEIASCKSDGTTPLPGAKLILSDEDGNAIDEWTSKETPHTVPNLEAGIYELSETEAPGSYINVDPIRIEVTEDDYGTVTAYAVVHSKVYHAISLIDADTKKAITGASITVTDESGGTVDTWETTEEAHLLPITPATKDSEGKYSPVYFIEPSGVTLPEGYASYTTTTTVYSQETGETASTTLKAYRIAARAYVVTDDGKNVAGAKMKVLDESGKTVESWISDGKSFHEMYLPTGSYTLSETAPPDYYMKGNDIKFTIRDTAAYQTVTMVNNYITVTFNKVDADTKKALPGAALIIKDENGITAADINGKELIWTTDGNAHSAVMKAGKYVLVEDTAPAGYTRAADVSFSIDNVTENQTVTITDKKIVISIYKTDAVTSRTLSGATLVLKDASGNAIDSWTTDGNAHKVAVTAGSYRLTETTAPAGYELARDEDITVTDTSDEQNFYMYDYPKDTTVNLTGKTRTKSKVIRSAAPASYSLGATADGKGGNTVTSNPGKTGDFNRYIYALALIVLGMGLACLFFIWRGKGSGRKDTAEVEEKEEKQKRKSKAPRGNTEHKTAGKQPGKDIRIRHEK